MDYINDEEYFWEYVLPFTIQEAITRAGTRPHSTSAPEGYFKRHPAQAVSCALVILDCIQNGINFGPAFAELLRGEKDDSE